MVSALGSRVGWTPARKERTNERSVAINVIYKLQFSTFIYTSSSPDLRTISFYSARKFTRGGICVT